MNQPLAILDLGHGYKNGRWDPGVQASGLSEADLVREYAPHTARILKCKGWHVETLDRGSYERRHQRGALFLRRPWSVAIYANLHVNGGPGDYGAALHDERSTLGQRAAEHVAEALGDRLPELSRVEALAAYDDRKPPRRSTHPWLFNSHYLVRHMLAYPGRCCGITCEPGFVGCPQHQPLWTAEGLVRVGAATAEGIDAWGVELLSEVP